MPAGEQEPSPTKPFNCRSRCERLPRATVACGTARRCWLWLALGALLRPLPASPLLSSPASRAPARAGEPRGTLPATPDRLPEWPPPARPVPGRAPRPRWQRIRGNGNVGGHPWEGKHHFSLWQPSAGRIKPSPAETRTFAAYRTSFQAPDGAVQGTSGWGGLWTPRPGPAARSVFNLSFRSGCRGVTCSPWCSPRYL